MDIMIVTVVIVVLFAVGKYSSSHGFTNFGFNREKILSVFQIGFYLFAEFCNCNYITSESRLLTDLLKDYNPLARPVNNYTAGFTTYVNARLRKVEKLVSNRNTN